MRNGLRVFDAHIHLGEAAHSGRKQTPGMMLEQMDRHGVDRALAIPFPMVPSYREAHNLIGEAVRSHPSRFVGAACLSPFLPQAEYRDEVRRCAEEFGFRALKFQPQFQPLDPSSSRAEFMFEIALEHRLAVVCHTGSGVPYALPSLLMVPARKYPNLKIIVAHCGGGGMLLPEAIVAALFCPNIFLELSTLMPNHVHQVLAQVPAARLMAGSDLPENIDVEMGKIVNLDIPEVDRQEILWGTACRVFGDAG